MAGSVNEWTTSKTWDLVLKFLAVLALPLAGVIVGHEMRLTKIEENRWTIQQDMESQQTLRAEIAANYPPVWLKQSLDRIEAALLKNTDKLEVLNARVSKLEN